MWDKVQQLMSVQSQWEPTFIDDASGKQLDSKLVEEGRLEELKVMGEMQVYTK